MFIGAMMIPLPEASSLYVLMNKLGLEHADWLYSLHDQCGVVEHPFA